MPAIIMTATATMSMNTMATKKQRSAVLKFAECGSGLFIYGSLWRMKKTAVSGRTRRSGGQGGFSITGQSTIGQELAMSNRDAQELGTPISPRPTIFP
jgi:hypothetical protein